MQAVRRYTVDPVAGFIIGTGKMIYLFLNACTWMVRRPFYIRELIAQMWFITSVTVFPALITNVPFGMIVSLQGLNIFKLFQAENRLGGFLVLAEVREISPVVIALVISGVGGAAITADLGSRRIRGEIDALESLAINPVQFLIVPRLIAAAIMVPLLNQIGSFAGLAGGYIMAVPIKGVNQGTFLGGLLDFTRQADVYGAVIKTILFGISVALVACYKGFNAAGGAKGVGRAVNEGVVVGYLVVFAINFFFQAFWFATTGSGVSE